MQNELPNTMNSSQQQSSNEMNSSSSGNMQQPQQNLRQSGNIFALPRQKSRSRDRRESRMFLVDGQLFWSEDTAGSLTGDKRHSSATSFAMGSSMDMSAIGQQSMDSSGGGGSGSGSEEVISYRIKWCRESIAQLKRQTWPMERKLATLKACKLFIKQHQGELKQSKQAKDVLSSTRGVFERYWRHFKRELANFLVIITPWEMRIKKIESHFGSVVASYFTFLRWIFWLNLANSLVLCSFVLVPELIENAPDVTGMRKGDLGMAREINLATGKPSDGSDLPEFNPALGEIWEFEGFLRYSPIFYGYYSNKEISRWGFWRNPLAYLMSVLLSFLFCFFCISRKLSQNSKLSRTGTKEDEYTFSWTVFVGWDFMIGNSETAYNKTSSLIMNLKEGIVEEKEQTKDRDWKLLSRRALANVISIMLIFSSAYIVMIAVQRSQNMPDNATWLQKNELQVVMSAIQFVFPPLFDAIGLLEGYHPRKGLNWQLGRILSLDFLNFYSLMYSLFDNVDKMAKDLNEVAGNITLLNQNQTYYKNLFTTTTTTSTTTTTTTAIPLIETNNTTLIASFDNDTTIIPDLNSTLTTTSNYNETNSSAIMTQNSSLPETTTTISVISTTLVSQNASEILISDIATTTTTTTTTTPATTNLNSINMPNSDYDYPDIAQIMGKTSTSSSRPNGLGLRRQIPPMRDPYRFATGLWRGTNVPPDVATQNYFQSESENDDDDDEPLEGRLDVTLKPTFGILSTTTIILPIKANAIARPIGATRTINQIQAQRRKQISDQSDQNDDEEMPTLSATTTTTTSTISNANQANGPQTIVSSGNFDLDLTTKSTMDLNYATMKPPEESNPIIVSNNQNALDSSSQAIQSQEAKSQEQTNRQLSSSNPNISSDSIVSFENSMNLTNNHVINATLCHLNKSTITNSNGTLADVDALAGSDCGEIPKFSHQEILANTTLREKMKTLCWETMFGQEMVKMVVMDLVVTVVSAVAFEFMRACFVRYCNRFFFWDLERGLPGYQDFKLAENVLHLVNNQQTVWMGMFFAPGLPAINTIKLAVLMYVRSWAVLTCNIPHETVFKVSKSNNFYYLILLLNLVVCIMPVAYAITWIRPSWHCGPFGGECRMYVVLTKLVNSMLPPEINTVLKYLASPGTIIPLMILLILIIYYLSSSLSSSKEANKDLKAQLKKDKDQERAVPEITSTSVVDTSTPNANLNTLTNQQQTTVTDYVTIADHQQQIPITTNLQLQQQQSSLLSPMQANRSGQDKLSKLSPLEFPSASQIHAASAAAVVANGSNHQDQLQQDLSVAAASTSSKPRSLLLTPPQPH